MRRRACSLVPLLATTAVLCIPGPAFAAPPFSAAAKARWRLTYSSPGPERFWGLSFSDATNGWMAGESGRILHTGDGGIAWAPQVNPSTNRLHCVDFVNARTGWAAGESNTVLRTSDGGRSWIVERPPGGPQTRTFLALQFVSEEEGWLAHNYRGLLHTRDGGRTWMAHEEIAPDALMAMCFLDARKGWILGVGGTLLHTSDGGQSWVPQPMSGMLDAVASFSRVFFSDSANGWVGTDTGISSRMRDAPPLLRTTDGGRTWSIEGRWPGMSVRDLWFRDPQSGWCMEFSGVYSTKDGGVSWVKELDSRGDPFVRMVFVGPARGWLLTFTGKVYVYSE